ncbi:aldehyde dehydrogenase [Candidatus Dojkabacteria bacterium]|nr:aldehyde dehydrogenase [Candidatus Dojkabacteria bacterium]
MSKITSTSPDKSLGVVGEIEITSESRIKEIVSTAKESFEQWSKLTVEERKEYLEKLYSAFEEKKEELAHLESKEMGMPIEESKVDLDSGLNYFRWYLDNASKYLSPEVSFENETEIHKVYYEPIGVAAVIMPWNFPFSNLIWGAIPNLMVGNTVVFKHSEEVVVTSKMYEDITSAVGLPNGVFNIIFGAGETGDQLVHSDIDLICFTGSTKTGQYLYKVGAEKMLKVLLELGGSAPGVCFEDVDLDNAVETVFINRFGNCGQICDGLKRMIVHESVVDEFTSKMKAKLQSIKVENPLDEDTNIGPLVAERQAVLLDAQMKDAVEKGVEVVIGGGRSENMEGAYYMPTILRNVTTDMRVWSEEVFGPVLPVLTFKTYEEAIQLANDTPYGLGGYVFTGNKELGEKCARDIKTGMVSVNGAFYVVPDDPFGGCKMSGIGREHGRWGLRELTEIKVIATYK